MVRRGQVPWHDIIAMNQSHIHKITLHVSQTYIEALHYTPYMGTYRGMEITDKEKKL